VVGDINGSIAMQHSAWAILIAGPAVLVRVLIGVTVPAP
jgi:hypothetical protein